MKKILMATMGIIAWAASTATAQPPTGWGAGRDTGIRCAKITNFFPELDTAGKTISYDTSYAYVYAYGNQMMYHVSYTHFTNYRRDKQRQDSTVRQRFYYRLVFTKGQPLGAYYNDRLAIYNQKVTADSMLKEDWVGGNRIVMDTVKNKIVLQSSAYLPNSDTLLEVYDTKVRADSNIYSTLYFYYVPLRPGLPYSIDTALEKAKKMTLCKANYFTHVGWYDKKGKFRVLEYRMQTETEPMPVANRAELLPYFERQKRGEYNAQAADVLKE
jgi:hypothetical protein